jgi:hypothetical protein
MPFRALQATLDRSTGPLRRALQYAYHDWTREMPKSKRIITWIGILMQGYAVYCSEFFTASVTAWASQPILPYPDE